MDNKSKNPRKGACEGGLRKSTKAGLDNENQGNEISRVSRAWVKDFGLYSECIRNLLENSEQRSDTIRFMF